MVLGKRGSYQGKRPPYKKAKVPVKATSAAMAAKSGNIRVGGVLGQEKKNHDVTYSVTGGLAASGNTGILLSSPAQGAGPKNRIGRQIETESLDIRVEMTGEISSDTIYRILVVKDNQANASNCTLGDVLEFSALTAAADNPNVTATSQPAVCSLYNNLGNSHRFRTLWDHRGVFKTPNTHYDVGSSSFVGTSAGDMVDVHLKLGDTIRFTESTQNGIYTNNDVAYHIFLISTANDIAFAVNSRMRFRG